MNLLTVELHCHTCHSKDSLMRPKDVLEICRKKGIDRIAITDHNAIEGAFEAARIDPERVIIGEEIKTSQGELLGYFMKEFIPPGLSPQETITLMRDQGTFISVAHPFDAIRAGAWREEVLRDILPLVDAIEIFNARSWTSTANERAKSFALQAGIPGTAGSDAHAPLEIGRAVMRLPSFVDRAGFQQSLAEAQILGRRSSRFVHFFSRYASFRKALPW
jgi:predicted metal-dependent phosphoesterase TrpH